MLNNTNKYVAPTTLTEPLPWRNSTLLKGDAAIAVARLFPDGGAFAALRLVATKETTTGVLVATYQPVELTAGKS